VRGKLPGTHTACVLLLTLLPRPPAAAHAATLPAPARSAASVGLKDPLCLPPLESSDALCTILPSGVRRRLFGVESGAPPSGCRMPESSYSNCTFRSGHATLYLQRFPAAPVEVGPMQDYFGTNLTGVPVRLVHWQFGQMHCWETLPTSPEGQRYAGTLCVIERKAGSFTLGLHTDGPRVPLSVHTMRLLLEEACARINACAPE
jgi:hypothetical protein